MYSVFPPVALNLRKQFEISKYFSEKKKKTKTGVDSMLQWFD